MMDRRTFLAITTAALTAALTAEAQEAGQVRRIGYLSGASGFGPREEAFRQGLRDLAYVEGQNLVIDWRFAEGRRDRSNEDRNQLDPDRDGVRQRSD